jgi:hypothetical protein
MDSRENIAYKLNIINSKMDASSFLGYGPLA